MKVTEYQNIAGNEQTHFYYVAVRDLVLRLIQKYVQPASPVRKEPFEILDAGCGTGWLSVEMASLGHITAIDSSDDAVRFVTARGIAAVEGSVEQLPIESNMIDLVTCVDVLYHKDVASDRIAMQEFGRVLRPGGWLVLRVPADKALFSNHDRLVQTARRYSLNEVEDLMKTAGLEQVLVTHCQWSLYLPAWIKARIECTADASIEKSAIQKELWPVNEALKFELICENRLLIGGLKSPIGLGIIAVGVKRA